MRTSRALSAAIFLGLLAGTMPAGEYYVAQKDAVADDGNPGTVEKPYKTIGAALPKLKAGDTLFIKQGVYRECVNLGRGESKVGDRTLPGMAAGAPGRPICVVAATGEKVVVNAGEPIAGWKQYKDSIYVKENWTDNTHQVFCGGKYLTQIGGDCGSDQKDAWFGKKGNGLADLEKGSFYLDPKEKKLYVWLPASDDPARHEMEYVVRPYTVSVDSDYITVAGIKMLYAPVGIGGSYNTLDNCEVAYAEFCNLRVSGKCNSVINCEINYGGNTGISTWGYGHRIIGGAVRFNNRRQWSRHWHAGGMKNFSSDTLISNVVAEGNVDSPGIWFDGNNTGVTIQNCTVFHNTNGIMYEIGERAIIKNNVCYENRSRGIDISNSSYMLIAQNLCYRNGKAGIGVYGGTRKEDSVTYADEETGVDPTRCNVVWGNILMDNWYEPLLPADEVKDGPELIMPDPKYKSNNANVSDYNIFFRTAKRPIRIWYNYQDGAFPDLKTWQQKTGQDRHSIVAEPLFANLEKYDFHPVAKSPAIAFVRSRLGCRMDMEDKDQHHDPMLTAGPYMADKKLQPPDTRPPRPVEVGTVLLNAPPLGDPFKLLAKALEELLAKTAKMPNGDEVVMLQGVPLAIAAPPAALVLDKHHPASTIAIARNAKTLHLAYVMIGGDKKGPRAHCKIVREDGMTLELKWEDLNWTKPEDAKAPKTVSGWKSKDGQTEILLTTWANDNEWYPIREMQWTLDDESAKIVILGVTAK